MKDPSWMELDHFLKFLDFQLVACENSIFCDENHAPGLKNFVMECMIRISKVHHTCTCLVECTIYCTVHFLLTCMCRILPHHL